MVKANVIAVRVMPSNSTVNGRNAVAKHDAREWFDGWKNLGIKNSRVYKDGKPAFPSCGEYLHVPVLEETDERFYRVRSRVWVGGKFRGRIVQKLRANRIHGIWHWVYTF